MNGVPLVSEPQAALDDAALRDRLAAVEAFLRRFVVFADRHHAPAVALWTAHTHRLDAADSTPYLAVTAPEKRSGKTRLLEVLELLVHRGGGGHQKNLAIGTHDP
ncbi:MAG: hypothetical protein M3O70_25665 [Actinomycetota bacterium]|nr:hypothetical protein [Actinomycetota bacterium]